jgi:DNA recombination protein RmuC
MSTIVVAVAAGVFTGLLGGALVTWLATRRYIEAAGRQARAESQTSNAVLEERVASSTKETQEVILRLAASENKREEFQAQIDSLREERAHLEERANRVSGLELQVGQLTADAKKYAEKTAGLEPQASRLLEVEKRLNAKSEENDQLRLQIANLREKLGSSESTITANGVQIAGLVGELASVSEKRDLLLAAQEELSSQIAQLATSLDAERSQSREKIQLLVEAKDQMTATFRSLASDILDEKSKKFAEQNKENLGAILDPLKTKIQDFQKKVEEVYFQEGKDRSALIEQVKQLRDLNQQLSEDAQSLTLALKGSSKAQGNWGELILERVLEDSGLRKDQEYLIRPSYDRGDGTRAQPDAVILLPENRNLIVDAKLSIDDYEEYVKAEGDAARADALKRHVACVRAHIKNLSEQGYQSLPDLRSLDFVVMFVPIEPAFMLAVANDEKIWQAAWEKNILLVSPSIFLFVVRTVANLWRQELQKKSIQEIVKRGAELYDKFAGFIDEFTKVGERLTEAKDSYDVSFARFCTGRGNVVRQVELLRTLGVRPSKSLPADLIEPDDEAPILTES